MATIQGQCAKCNLYFDVRNGLECPHCHSQMAPVPHVRNAAGTCVDDCSACIWFEDEQRRKETQTSADWLEQLYSLKDTR